MTTKKLFRRLHLWLSLPIGIVISLICFSGATLVFETEICEILDSHLYKVEKKATAPLSLPTLVEIAKKSLPDSVKITGATIYASADRSYQFNLSAPSRASIYIDQYTGEVKGKYERKPFFDTMFRLHRWLLNPPAGGEKTSIGKTIVGVCTLLLAIILLTGFIIWLPKSLNGLKNRLSVQTGKGWKRFFYDLHVSAGFYAGFFLLIMALTGLTWSFPWYRTTFHSIFGAKPDTGDSLKATSPHAHHERGRQKNKEISYQHWDKIYAQIKQINPDAKSYTISSETAGANVGAFATPRATNKYTLGKEGEILTTDNYAERPLKETIQTTVYSVHVGTWGGFFTRILAFLSALIGCTLPITGYYLWIKRTFKKKNA